MHTFEHISWFVISKVSAIVNEMSTDMWADGPPINLCIILTLLGIVWMSPVLGCSSCRVVF